MKYWIGFLTFTIAVLSLFVINAYCNDLEYSNDNAGVLISALGVLVTFVVAWQIWQTIDAKNTINRFQEEIRVSQQSAKVDIKNVRNLCMALLSNHEGESALNEENETDAYLKYFTSLCFFLMIGDPNDAPRIEKNIKLVEKLLDKVIAEGNADQKNRLKEIDKDIDAIYDAVIIFSQSISLPQHLVDKIQTLHNRRKEFLEKT